MRIMSDLISLKERYMDRVHLILGNRDINKLRIQATTHKAVLQCLPRTYWVKSPMEDIIPTGYKLGDIESKMKWVCMYVLFYVYIVHSSFVYSLTTSHSYILLIILYTTRH